MMIPVNNLVITKNTLFEPGIYFIPNGIRIEGSGITLDGNGAFMIGDKTSIGISINGREDITIKNIFLSDYFHGIKAESTKRLTINNCHITHTNELAANTLFLDIWVPFERAYGSGIILNDVQECSVYANDLSHQMNGILTYHCDQINVQNNIANYCSGWGFHLNDTRNSIFEKNYADYCCRYEPRGPDKGHVGADSAGFLIVNRSCNNIFRDNFARLGGDGFFLAGFNPDYEPSFCNNNLFEKNDGSYSPNNAFEATFSSGNIFRSNKANFSNYGFWLGFSKDIIVEDNQIDGNRSAGIATENGINFTVRANSISNCHHGILLWSKHVPKVDTSLPENTTSKDWKIESNIFSDNEKAIRIAADQDHGVRQLPTTGELGYPAPKPARHIIRCNKFIGNTQTIDEIGTIDSTFEQNEIDDPDKMNLVP